MEVKKTFNQKLLSWLMCLLMVLNLIPQGLETAFADGEGGSSGSGGITEVDLQTYMDAGQTKIQLEATDGVYYTLDDLQTNGKQVSKGAGIIADLYFDTITGLADSAYIHYQLPENLLQPGNSDFFQNVKITDSNDSTVTAGTWSMSDTGLITVKFNSDYIANNKHPDGTVDLHEFNMHFSGNLSSERGEENKNGDNVLVFQGASTATGNGISYTIPFEYPNVHAAIQITKTHEFDSAEKVVKYTITVTAPSSNDKTAKYVSVVDNFTEGSKFLSDKYTIDSKSDGTTFAVDDNKGKWTIGDMEPDTVKTLVYTAKVSNEYFTTQNASISNEATVTFNNSRGEITVNDNLSDVGTVLINKKIPENAYSVKDGKTYITYLLTVTAYGGDVANVVVKDAFEKTDAIDSYTEFTASQGEAKNVKDDTTNANTLEWDVGTVVLGTPATLTYKAEVSNVAWDEYAQKSDDNKQDGTFKLQLKNTADVYVKSDSGELILYDSSSVTSNATKILLTKSGKADGNGNITYTVKVNDPSSGMNGNVSYIKDEIDFGEYVGDYVTVAIKNQSGETTKTYDVPLNKIPDGDKAWKIDLTNMPIADGATVNVASTEATPLAYELTYKVKFNGYVTNTAGAGYEGSSGIPYSHTVTFGGSSTNFSYSKNVTAFDLSHGLVSWQIAIDSDIPAESGITDNLSAATDKGHSGCSAKDGCGYITEDQISDIKITQNGNLLILGEDYVILNKMRHDDDKQILNSDAETSAAEANGAEASNEVQYSDTYHGFQIKFLKNIDAGTLIEYSSTIDTKALSENHSGTKWQDYNKCTFSYNIGKPEETSEQEQQAYVISYPSKNSMAKHYVTYDKSSGEAIWYIQLNLQSTVSGDAVLTEYLPYGMTFSSANILDTHLDPYFVDTIYEIDKEGNKVPISGEEDAFFANLYHKTSINDDYIYTGVEGSSARIDYKNIVTDDYYTDDNGNTCQKVTIPLTNLQGLSYYQDPERGWVQLNGERGNNCPSLINWNGWGQFTMRVRAKLSSDDLKALYSDADDITSITYKNKAVFGLPDGTTIDEDTESGTISTIEELLTKEQIAQSGAALEYSMDINPASQDLVSADEDNNIDGNKLTVIDAMGAGMTLATNHTAAFDDPTPQYFDVFDVTSLSKDVVYKSDGCSINADKIREAAKAQSTTAAADDEGSTNKILLTEGEDYTLVDITGQNTDGTTAAVDGVTEADSSASATNKTYEITLPDSKHIVILYWANISGSEDEEVAVSNDAYFTYTGSAKAKDASSTSGTVKILAASSSVFTGPFFNIKKTDSSTGDVLEGAIYTMYDAETNEEYMSATTGENGLAYFGHRTDDTTGREAIQKNALYYIQETKAPDGYQLDPNRYYFEFKTAGYDALTVDGYEVHQLITGDTITFTDEQGVSIPVTKVWNDGGLASHDSVTVNLLANGEAAKDDNGIDITLTLSDTDGWKGTFQNLPLVDSDGNSITYTVEEETPDGYVSNIVQNDSDDVAKGFTITNTLTRDIAVQKNWVDDDATGSRSNVTVNLYKNNAAYDSLTLTAENGWTGSFDKLDMYDADGKLITYTVKEAYTPSGYIASNGGEGVLNKESGVYVITNTAATSVSGKKVWNDADNQDGKRPTSIVVNLTASNSDNPVSIVVNAEDKDSDGNWTWTFENLPKYYVTDDGKTEEITYTVTEDQVSYYDPADIAVDENTGFITITNKHTPATTSVKIVKDWKDNDNQDGLRQSVEVKLYADSELVTIDGKDTITLSEDNNWSSTITDLPIYANGEKITYSIKEVTSIDGYKSSISADPENAQGVVSDSGEDGVITFTITNIHETATTSVTVTKTWDDDSNHDGKRPDDVTVYLLANGSRVDDKSITLNADNNWSASFEGLDKYASGQPIEYSVEEKTIEGYKLTENKVTQNADDTFSVTLTNTHEIEKISIPITKVWEDSDNQDGLRPESLTANLLVDGEVIKTAEFTPSQDNKNEWTCSFTDLDKYANNGEEIKYTVEEADVPDGYKAETTGSIAGGFTITNTHEAATRTVKVQKAWDDVNNQDGIRPANVTVQLKADGDDYPNGLVILDESNNWTASFEDLPTYKDGGTLIEYTFEEKSDVSGYSHSPEASAVDETTGIATITNTHTPETIVISGSKTWSDADNQDGKRPKEITINLLRNGDTIDSRTVTADDNWSWDFGALPKYYDQGKEFNYTITEDAVDGYTSTYDGFNVTNTHKPDTTSVTVKKKWIDNNNENGTGNRPSNVTVQLVSDGIRVPGKFAVLDDDNNWTATFMGLEINKSGKVGQAINYTFEEVSDVNGYEQTGSDYDVNGDYVITNTLLRDITVTKIWADDDNGIDGNRPESITVNLKTGKDKDGDTGQSVTLSADENNNWNSATFKDLVKYTEEGEEIQYGVVEENVCGYDVSYGGNMAEGLTITNTLQRINLDVTKSWDDFDNTYEDRADLTVRLKSGEGDAAEPFRDMKVDLTKDNGWTGTFVGLPKYQNKQEVTYSVSEDPITGYTFTGSEAVYDTNNVLTGFVVSNKLDTISVTVNKVWDDNDNADQNRTDIKVSLLKKFADETSEDAWKAVEENVTVSKNASGQWTYTFNKLPKYQNQKALEYKVAEETVTGYVDPVVSKPAVDANGNYTFTITNKLATTSVKVTKVWDDDSNRDGIRPDIEVKLMADKHDGSGELQEVATCTLSAKDAVANEDGTTNNNTWSYTFDKLPIYHNGVKITYSVVESAIEDGSLEYYTPANEPESAEGVVSNEETDNVIDFTITNTHEVFRTFVTATKTWDDADDQDGKRPDEITLHLWKNKGIEGSEEEVDHATVTPDEDGNWTYTFDNLYKNEAGKEIAYTIEEEDVDLYDLDSNSVSKDADGNPVVALVNKHVPSVIDIDVEKVWNDGENQDGIRMDEVKVQLYADGAEVADQVLILNADNDWKGTFSGLDEYAKGQKIDYTVKEVVEDEWAELYTNEVTGTLADGYLITNTHVPYMTSVSVTKVWNDSDNLDGSRPDSVTVQLLANGEALEGKTLTLSETNGWADTFADLPEYANGEKIVYTVEEAAVEGYTTEITGSADEGFVITNSHEPVVEVVTTAQTGDSSNILLWMLSSIISGLTLVGAWIIRRRRLA